MADEDDAVALGRQAAQDREDLLGLLGREDGGRLVEDEDPRLAVERLEDLDPLLPADRQRADLGVGVDLEAELLGRARRSAGWASFRSRKIAVGHRLLAEEDVLGDGQDRDEHEVLVDHADPAGDGVGGPVMSTALAVEQDLALVGHGQPVEDVHQGRLAGAVLAEQGVDLARAEVEVDRVVGEDARVALGDAAHLEHGRWPRSQLSTWSLDASGRMIENGPTRGRPVRAVGRTLPLRLQSFLSQAVGLQGSTVPAFIPARAASILAWISGVTRSL